MRLLSKTMAAMLPALLAVSLAATLPPSAVHASTVRADPSRRTEACTADAWGPNLAVNAPDSKTWNTKWVNNVDGCWQRSAIHCEAAFGVNWWSHSKWTITNGVWGYNRCPASDTVLALGWDIGKQAGAPYDYDTSPSIRTAHLTALGDDGSGQTGSLDPNESLDPNVPAPATFPDGVWELGTNLDQSTIPDAAFCMFVDGRYCQDSQGPDNPFLVESSAFSDLVAVHAGACNYCYTIHVNSTGRCQFGSSTDNVELSTTTCDQSQSREVVEAFSRIVNGVTRWSFYNTGRGNWYGTNGPHDGYRVLIESVHSGFYTGWCVQPASGSC